VQAGDGEQEWRRQQQMGDQQCLLSRGQCKVCGRTNKIKVPLLCCPPQVDSREGEHTTGCWWASAAAVGLQQVLAAAAQ